MIITDHFLDRDTLKQLHLLLTLKVTLHLLKVPKDKNEELLFSKWQFNSFSLITTVSCCDSTLYVYGFGPKISLTCEITFTNTRKYGPTIYFYIAFDETLALVFETVHKILFLINSCPPKQTKMRWVVKEQFPLWS